MASGGDRSVLTRPVVAPDAVVAYGAGVEQVADVYRGAGGEARPLVVLIHGGYWRPQYDRAHLRPMAQALAVAGWSVALPEYTRVPGDPDAALADVALAVRGLPDLLSRHDGQVILAGHSAGGHLALCAASKVDLPALAGVLVLAPVADLQLADELDVDGGAVREFLGQPASARPDLDPCRLALPAVPVTVIHGDADTLAPVALTDSYAAAHPAAHIVLLPGVEHFQVIDPRSLAWPAVVAELARFAAGCVHS